MFAILEVGSNDTRQLEMHTERNTGGEIQRHRPLPSVGLALLPHERRAIRIRRLAGVSVVFLTVGGGAAAAIFAPDLLTVEDAAPPVSKLGTKTAGQPLAAADPTDPSKGVPASPAASALSSSTSPLGGALERAGSLTSSVDESSLGERGHAHEPSSGSPQLPAGIRRIRRKFGEGHGFRQALRSAGASREEAVELVAALEKLIDFRRCKPEHELVFERDAKDKLVGFEFHAGVTEVYRAVRGKSGKLEARQVAIEIDKRRISKGGQVTSSLGQALEAVGLGNSFAGVFVEVFEGHVSFKKETRAGDSFKVVVDEQYVDGSFLGFGTVHALEYVGERVGAFRAFWYEPKRAKGDFFDAKGRAMQGGWLRTPLRYDHISSEYDLRRMHPILKRIMPHHGIDYAASPGTIVWAAGDGVVKFAGARGLNGNLVVLRHEGGYETFYAHLLRIVRGIRRGVRIRQRQPLGAVGSSGLSTGPHLHFALKRHGRFINPAKLLNGPGKPLPQAEMPRFRRTQRRLMAELERITLPPRVRGRVQQTEVPLVDAPATGVESLDFE